MKETKSINLKDLAVVDLNKVCHRTKFGEGRGIVGKTRVRFPNGPLSVFEIVY